MNQVFRTRGFKVPEKSNAQICERAQLLLDMIKDDYGFSTEPLNLPRLFDFWGSRSNCGTPKGWVGFEVVPDSELLDRAGEYDAVDMLIKLPDSVWDAVCDGCPDAYFTALHELGHWALGHKAPALPRMYDEFRLAPPETDSEAQADRFAIEFSMDKRRIDLGKDAVGSLMRRFNVPKHQAIKRILELSKENAQRGKELAR